MRLIRILLAIQCVAFAPAAVSEVVTNFLTSPLAAAFGSAPAIGRPRLSPDASKMLFLQKDLAGNVVATVADLVDGSQTLLANGEEETNISWCEWANETRIICNAGIAINADGSEPLRRFRVNVECLAVSGIAATEQLLNWLPEQPELVSNCSGTTRYNVYTGSALAARAGDRVVGRLLADGHGFSRLQQRTERDYVRWYVRDGYESEWRLFEQTEPLHFEDPFWPVGFDQSTDYLYHLEWDAGRWGLAAIDLENDFERRTVFRHPLLDTWFVDTTGPFGRVVAAAFLDGRPQRFVVDERIAEVYQAALLALPDQNVEVVQESWDGNSYLVLARPPGKAGDYYLVGIWSDTISFLGSQYPQLAEIELAETRTISFEAADGGTVAGHLTLPVDRAGPLPAVIVPRAVPSRLDIADPHYLVQFLAASGYAVLRVNYRGDDSYGSWLPGRVRLGWQQAVADTIDAVRYLIDEGIALEDRICTVGRDVGAYVGIMTALEHPDALSCIVSIGGEVAGYASPDVVGLVEGDVRRDVRNDGSPQKRAKDLSVPIVMFNGVFGDRSSLVSTRDFSRSLERAEKDSALFEYEFGWQDIVRQPYRIDMLTRIGAFLAEHIGDI
jgi:hypothetical protein